MARLPLEGIRVVDITVIWAGPYASMLLADWGAEVIRVESRQHWQVYTRAHMAKLSERFIFETCAPYGYGAYCRQGYDPNKGGINRWCLFNAHARNKLSMTADLTRPEGLDIFKRLIRVSDILIESNPPLVKERLGIKYDVLREVKPDLIMLSMPGFGQYGPYKDYKALGAHQEGFLGHTYVRGYPDMDIGTNTTVYHTDEAGGAHAAAALLMALHYRNRTGRGQFIDLAQAEATMPQLGEAFMDYTMNRRVTERTGNRDIHSAVQGCYLCQGAEPGIDTPPGEDKWINITIFNDEQWAGLCSVMGRPELTTDEHFSDQVARLQNHDEIDRLITGWTRQHDNYALMYQLQREGVPAGPVLDDRSASEDPHLKERGFFEPLTHAECGTHVYPGLSWHLSKTPNHLRLPPCMFGEHNEYVYKQVIGVSDEEYARLEAEGHIGTNFVPEVP